MEKACQTRDDASKAFRNPLEWPDGYSIFAPMVPDRE